jgi:hypothetical protein
MDIIAANTAIYTRLMEKSFMAILFRVVEINNAMLESPGERKFNRTSKKIILPFE